MSRDFEDIFLLEPENFDEWQEDAQEGCRRTSYKSFANSLKNGCNFIHAIYPITNEEFDSDLIDTDECDEELSRTSFKKFDAQELPKAFQNPMISPLRNDSLEIKVSVKQNFQNQESNILNSLKTVISFNFSSSCQSSESNYELRRENCEKSILPSNGQSFHSRQSYSIEKSSANSFDHRFSGDSNELSHNNQDKIEKHMTKLCMIGEGSEARVFLCELDGSESLIAYKEYKQQKIDFARVKNEFHLVECLDHPNIIKYHYLKTKNCSRDSFGIVMEFMEGGTLLEYLTSNSQNLKYEDKINLAQQIIEGLTYLHNQNIIHGDLKPENIFLSNDKTKAKIGDFGIAEKVSNDSQILYKQTGSLFYMAPEMLLNQQFSKKADIWSLGCILYFLFFGKHPFEKITRLSELQDMFIRTSSIKLEENETACDATIRNIIESCLCFSLTERNIFTTNTNAIF